MLSHANTTGEDIWDVLARPQAVPGLGAAALKSVARFAEMMEELRERAERDRARSPSCSRRCCSDTGYIEALEAERTIEAEGRIENLEELVGVAGEFDANRELEGESEDDAAGGVPGPDLARTPTRTTSARRRAW